MGFTELRVHAGLAGWGWDSLSLSWLTSLRRRQLLKDGISITTLSLTSSGDEGLECGANREKGGGH